MDAFQAVLELTGDAAVEGRLLYSPVIQTSMSLKYEPASGPLNPTPSTRTPKPHTLNPNPETPQPQPEPRNPTPETRTPKPETRNLLSKWERFE